LTGSIVSNLLFGLGLAMSAGGLNHRTQSFNPNAAHIVGALMTLASFGLIIPAVFQFSAAADREISREIAGILFLVYLASLAYTLLTSKAALGKDAVKAELKESGARPDEVEEPGRGMNRNQAIGLLAVVGRAGRHERGDVGGDRACRQVARPHTGLRRRLPSRPGRQRTRALQ